MDGEPKKDPSERMQKLVRKVMKGAPAPHLVEMTGALVREFGGVQPFVKEMFAQYQSCPPAQKGSWMRSFVKMVESATAMGGADRDISQMAEEDIRRELERVTRGKDQ